MERVTSDLHSPRCRDLSLISTPSIPQKFCLLRKISRNISNLSPWKTVLFLWIFVLEYFFPDFSHTETNPRQLLARAIYTRFLSFKNNNGHVLSHKLKCIIPRHFWGWHKKRKQMWKPRAVLWGRGIAAWSVFIAGSVSDAVTYQCIYRGHQSSPALFFNPHQEKGY